MDVTTLINEYKKRFPDMHFFDADTLAVFGERISEMKVLPEPQEVYYEWDRKNHICWVLMTYQRKSPAKNKWHKFYFDVNTFEQIRL